METIRQYAEERLTDTNEAYAVRARHAEVFAALARTASPGLDRPDLATWVERLGAEHANLLAAFGWLTDRGDAATVWKNGRRSHVLLASVGQFADARRNFDWCLAHDDVDSTLQLRARWGAAHLAYYGGDYLRAYDSAIDTFARAGPCCPRPSGNAVGTIRR